MKRLCRSLRPSLLAFLAASLLLSHAPALRAAAAGDPVAFQGRVLDPAGLPIPEARITVMAKGSGSTPAATAVSGPDGRFTLELAAGSYDLRVEVEGFAETVQHVTLTANNSTPLDLVLQGTVHESITVEAQSGYLVPAISSGTKTPTPLRDVPQSVTVVTRQLMQDQLMTSMGDVIRYVPGISLHQGENNRDQVVIRGNSSSADFFVDGVRDDVQYYRDLYNLDRVEAL